MPTANTPVRRAIVSAARRELNNRQGFALNRADADQMHATRIGDAVVAAAVEAAGLDDILTGHGRWLWPDEHPQPVEGPACECGHELAVSDHAGSPERAQAAHQGDTIRGVLTSYMRPLDPSPLRPGEPVEVRDWKTEKHMTGFLVSVDLDPDDGDEQSGTAVVRVEGEPGTRIVDLADVERRYRAF